VFQEAMQMARVTVCVLILVILGVTTTEVSSQTAGEDQAIMQVMVANAEGFYRRGTAFHAGNGIFYTNVHFQVDVESGFTLGGSSGSPVIGPDGTVVGIHYASTTQGRTSADVTFAISVQAVRSGCPLP